jgi:hypothetical protein
MVGMLAIVLSIRFSGAPVGAAAAPYGTASFQLDVVVGRKWLQSVSVCYRRYQSVYVTITPADQSTGSNSQADLTASTSKQEQSSLLV